MHEFLILHKNFDVNFMYDFMDMNLFFIRYFQFFKFMSSLHEEKPSQKLSVGKIYVAAITVPLGKNTIYRANFLIRTI